MAADGGTDHLSRMYAVEARYSVTGTNADHRVRATHAEVEAFAFEVARGLGVNAPNSSVALSQFQKDAAKQVAVDLKANSGKALVLAGRNQPAVVHAITAVMNEALGASAAQVKYHPDARRAADAMGDMEGAKALTTALNGGKVDALVIIGGNPAYTFPADLKFAEAVKKAGEVIYLTDMANETSAALDAAKSLVIPRAHYLEAWGDSIGIDGQVAIQQPLIQPLHQAVSDLELLAALGGDAQAKGYDIVRGAWKSATGAVGFHKRWRKWLHEGVLEDAHSVGAATSKKATSIGSLGASSMKNPSADKLDVIFVSGHNSFDGRFANNSWLMELPDPLTKITWDNAAVLSPKTASDLGVKDEDMVTVTLGDASLKTVAWVLPGQADDTVTLTLGYGRSFDNHLPYHKGAYNEGKVTGFNVGTLRNSGSASVASGASVKATGETYIVAAVQRHDNSRQYSIEGFDVGKRPALVREATVAEYKANETFAQAGIIKHHKMPDSSKFAVIHPPEESIFGDFRDVSDEQRKSHPDMPDYTKGIQWGMVIDLNTCTGCNACMVACVAENNIPMVGKDQVRRGREMHWIRMDRYFVGDESNPEVVHQPLACQQCETAPCENVCPVAATVHSPEGLNDMVYNRCIGTRYCANNCPFKVRRFNFYNYTRDQDELIHMQRNPNVTVRFRGVMEKCTYCVQRINKGKRRAALNPEVATQIIARITPACAQGCPTKAIVFGDINDKGSEVARYKAAARDYRLLSELNVQGRTSFLAKIRNPNPNFPTASASSATQAG
jgi:molybdopterin-containing oxidoreductase family iron-sulfur binding subunit